MGRRIAAVSRIEEYPEHQLIAQQYVFTPDDQTSLSASLQT